MSKVTRFFITDDSPKNVESLNERIKKLRQQAYKCYLKKHLSSTTPDNRVQHYDIMLQIAVGLMQEAEDIASSLEKESKEFFKFLPLFAYLTLQPAVLLHYIGTKIDINRFRNEADSYIQRVIILTAPYCLSPLVIFPFSYACLLEGDRILFHKRYTAFDSQEALKWYSIAEMNLVRHNKVFKGLKACTKKVIFQNRKCPEYGNSLEMIRLLLQKRLFNGVFELNDECTILLFGPSGIRAMLQLKHIDLPNTDRLDVIMRKAIQVSHRFLEHRFYEQSRHIMTLALYLITSLGFPINYKITEEEKLATIALRPSLIELIIIYGSHMLRGSSFNVEIKIHPNKVHEYTRDMIIRTDFQEIFKVPSDFETMFPCSFNLDSREVIETLKNYKFWIEHCKETKYLLNYPFYYSVVEASQKALKELRHYERRRSRR